MKFLLASLAGVVIAGNYASVGSKISELSEQIRNRSEHADKILNIVEEGLEKYLDWTMKADQINTIVSDDPVQPIGNFKFEQKDTQEFFKMNSSLTKASNQNPKDGQTETLTLAGTWKMPVNIESYQLDVMLFG